MQFQYAVLSPHVIPTTIYLINRICRLTRCHFLPNRLHLLGKDLPVLRIDDGLDRRTEHLHVVLAQGPCCIQLNATVQSSLTTEV